MTQEQRLKNMEVPQGIVDVMVDTDAYNELDDQFAIAYLLRAPERVRIRALMAAPFLNNRSTSPADGMRKSEAEIRKLLQLAGCDEMQEMVYSGSEDYLPDEKTPVESPAARRLVELSQSYTAENPLYIVALGAITNVASALLMDPTMKDRVVLSWLGGHALHAPHTGEFNMKQDIAAARVVFGSGIPLIQLPCVGCVDIFRVSGPELEYWLSEKKSSGRLFVSQYRG